jgi:hypothetical protein
MEDTSNNGTTVVHGDPVTTSPVGPGHTTTFPPGAEVHGNPVTDPVAPAPHHIEQDPPGDLSPTSPAHHIEHGPLIGDGSPTSPAHNIEHGPLIGGGTSDDDVNEDNMNGEGVKERLRDGLTRDEDGVVRDEEGEKVDMSPSNAFVNNPNLPDPPPMAPLGTGVVDPNNPTRPQQPGIHPTNTTVPGARVEGNTLD